MLGKLMKYELKSSARTLCPLYLGFLIIALICGIQMRVLAKRPSEMFFMPDVSDVERYILTFSMILLAVLCVAIMVLTVVVIIQRFNKSLIGDEGYLMFTLPVSHTQLLCSKLFAGVIWIVAGALVMGLSGLFIGLMLTSVTDILEFWNMYVPIDFWEYVHLADIAAGLLSGLAEVIAFILTVYLSIMIAQTERFNNHRVAIAVVIYFILNWLITLVEQGLLTFLLMDFFTGMAALTWFNAVFSLLVSVACFEGILWLMKHKLNL